MSASSNTMHFVRTYSTMRVQAQGLLLSKRFEIMEKLYTTKAFLKTAGGSMHIAYSSPCPPVSARGHKLQQPLKELTYFSHLALLLLFFLLKGRVKGGGGGMAQCLSPKYATDISIFGVIFRINCKI